MLPGLLLFAALFSQAAPDVSSHLRNGLVALRGGDLQAAQTELEAARAEEPQNPLVSISLAQLYQRQGLSQKAEQAAQQTESLADAQPAVWHALALYRAEAQQFDKAGQAEEMFSRSPRSDAGAASRAAGYYLRAQEFSQAAQLAEKAAAQQPNDPQPVLTLGVARYGQRRFDDAVTAFLKVVELDNSAEQPYIFLGRMIDQLGERLPQVTELYRQRLQREPQNPQAQLLLAEATMAADSTSEAAFQLLRQAETGDPSNWEIHYQLGVLLESRREFRNAATELQKAVDLNGRKAAPHYHLARVYRRLGEADKAEIERITHARLTGVPEAQ